MTHEIAHYIVAGLNKEQFIASRKDHLVLTERGENYFASRCQEQERQDTESLHSDEIDQNLYAEKQEQRRKALEVLDNYENMVPYYLLICAHDDKLADAFKAATPDILQRFAPLVNIIYQTQYNLGLMGSVGSFVSEENMKFILERSKLIGLDTIYINIGRVIQYCTLEEKNAMLDPALFCLLDHMRERLTPEQIKAIEDRKNCTYATHQRRSAREKLL